MRHRHSDVAQDATGHADFDSCETGYQILPVIVVYGGAANPKTSKAPTCAEIMFLVKKCIWTGQSQ